MKEITLVIPAGNNTEIEAIKNLDKNKFDIIVERGENPSRNRNIGAWKAKTKYIAFINAHTILDSNWYGEVIKFFKEHPKRDIVGGPQVNHASEGLFAKSSGYALGSIFGAAGSNKRYKKGELDLDADETLLTSANLICKKKVFEKISFDETIYPGEDPKFIEDAKKAGFRVAYSPDIIVSNLRRTNIFALAKQIFNYGKTRPQKESFFSTLKKPSFLIPPAFLLYILTLAILGIFGIFNFYLALPLVLYIVLDLGFSLFLSAINNDILSFFILIFIYPTVHLSYGAGFLASTIKKFKLLLYKKYF